MIKYEKASIDFQIEWVRTFEGEENANWWDTPYKYNSLVISHAGIIMGGLEPSTFFITNILSFGSGYRITLEGDYWFANYDDEAYSIRMPFPRYHERKNFDLIFVPDGDFMDVYLDNLDTKFATFAKVDITLVAELKNLIKTNTCDLTTVVWPRRADGSMDYPPPRLTQTAVTEQPETADIADYGEAAEPDPAEETAAQQTAAGFPWVIMAIIVGIAVIGGGLTAFVVLRKKQ
ncbi:MAG: hypothetical protein LBP60_07945 [Spirochaetaceae bacterium]|jgi:hypothetical protein|nr:hypothetical protein [Spirochaetaceae bacterium]